MVFDFSVLARKYPVGKYVYIMEDGKKKRFRVSGYSFSNGKWHVDMEGEIRFLLSRLEDLEIKMDSPVMIGEILSGMKKAVCASYCRFPACYEDEEELQERHCDRCPLNCLK